MNEKNKLPERANASGRTYTTEELAKALRLCAADGADGGSAVRCDECTVCGDDGKLCYDRLNLLAADRLEELAEQTRWISTEERMPDLDDGPATRDGELFAVSVLAVIEGAEWGTELYFDGDEFFDMQGDELIPYRVTHWRPMPKRTEAGHE